MKQIKKFAAIANYGIHLTPYFCFGKQPFLPHQDKISCCYWHAGVVVVEERVEGLSHTGSAQGLHPALCSADPMQHWESNQGSQYTSLVPSPLHYLTDFLQSLFCLKNPQGYGSHACDFFFTFFFMSFRSYMVMLRG